MSWIRPIAAKIRVEEITLTKLHAYLEVSALTGLSRRVADEVADFMAHTQKAERSAAGSDSRGGYAPPMAKICYIV